MGTLIILALSNLATMLLTAWLLHRQRTGQSPIPTLPAKADASTDDPMGIDTETSYTKGRPVL